MMAENTDPYTRHSSLRPVESDHEKDARLYIVEIEGHELLFLAPDDFEYMTDGDNLPEVPDEVLHEIVTLMDEDLGRLERKRGEVIFSDFPPSLEEPRFLLNKAGALEDLRLQAELARDIREAARLELVRRGESERNDHDGSPSLYD